MFGLEHVLFSFLLSLPILAQVTADAAAEPDPAFDKWDFAKKTDFGGDRFRKNSLTNREGQESTGKLLPILDVESEEPDQITMQEEESFPSSQEVHRHHGHENPSFFTPKKIDSKSFGGFFKSMFSSTTTTTSVSTTSTISTLRFRDTRFTSYSRFGSSSSQTSSVIKSSDLQPTEPATTSTTPPGVTSGSQIADVLVTVTSEVLVSSTDSAFSATSFSTALPSSSLSPSTDPGLVAFRTSTTSMPNVVASKDSPISTTRGIPSSDVTGTVASKALVLSTSESAFSISTSSIASVSSTSASPTIVASQASRVTSTSTSLSTVSSTSSSQSLSGFTSVSTLMASDEIIVSLTTNLVSPLTSSLATVTVSTSLSPVTSKTVKTSVPIASTSSKHVSSDDASSPKSDISIAVPSEVLVSSSTEASSATSSTQLTTSGETVSFSSWTTTVTSTTTLRRTTSIPILDVASSKAPLEFEPSNTTSYVPFTTTLLFYLNGNLSSPTAASEVTVPTSTDFTSLRIKQSSPTPIASVSSSQVSSTSVKPLEVFDVSIASGATEFSTLTSSEGVTENTTSLTSEVTAEFSTSISSDGVNELSTSTVTESTNEGTIGFSTSNTSEDANKFSISTTSEVAFKFSTLTSSEGVTDNTSTSNADFSTSTTPESVNKFSISEVTTMFPSSTTSESVRKFSTSTISEGTTMFPTSTSSEGVNEFSASTTSEVTTEFSTFYISESVDEFSTLPYPESVEEFATLSISEVLTKFSTSTTSESFNGFATSITSEGINVFSTSTTPEGVVGFSTSTTSKGSSEVSTFRSTKESPQTAIATAAEPIDTESEADPRESTETLIVSLSPTLVTLTSSTVSTSSTTTIELFGDTRARVSSTMSSTSPSTLRDSTEPSNTVAVLMTAVKTAEEYVGIKVATSNNDEAVPEAITEEVISTDISDVAEVEQSHSKVSKPDFDNETTTKPAVTRTSLAFEMRDELVDESSDTSEVLESIEEDISTTLPPGSVTSNLETEGLAIFGNDENIVKDDVSAFLPPGFVTNDVEDDSENTKDKKKGLDESSSRSGLLSRGFFPANDANIVADDIASLPSGFLPKSRVSSLKSRYKSLHKKSRVDIDDMEDDFDEKPETDLSGFGRVTTTTVDPISEILANVVILDVANYLPKGYDFSQVETEEEEVNEDVENINDLLISKEDEKKSEFKPGKLNGKKLAAIAKELKEADRYYSSVGEEKLDEKIENVLGVAKEMPKSSSGPKNKTNLKTKDQNNENERNGKKISDATFELSAESIFASILGGEEIKIDKVEEELKDELKQVARPRNTYGWREPEENVESTASVRPTKSIPPSTTSTPRPTTTSTPRPTTPGVCGDFCNLAGTIFIKSGLEWSEELLYPSTGEYKDVTKEVVKEMSTVFDNVYFGSAFEFASVEAFSARDGMVLVDIYVQFSDIVFNITTKDVKESFEEVLTVEGSKKMMGMFEIDMVWTYFMVVDTTIPLASMTTELQGVFLPDWALLVAVVGVISTFIIAFLGVVMGINKCRHNQVLKTRVLNPKTLQQFRGQRHFDTVEVDHVTAYATDKRDMWTLQKVNQEKRRSKSSLGKKFGYADSGRGSSSTRGSEKYFATQLGKPFGNSGKGFYERFPSLGKGSSSGNNHNDSNAELLGGFDNSGFNSSGEILEKDTADRDTSYENEKDDYEVRLGARGKAVYRRSDEQRNLSRADLLHSLGEQGMDFGDSDSSLDAVSEGPSERL